MKRTLTVLVASLTVAAALVAARTQDPQDKPQKSGGADVTITGCLIQGSGPTVFLLDNARLNPQDKNEKGKTYKIAGSVQSSDLSKQVNHEVAATGMAEAKVAPMPPAGQAVQEKDLPKFEAKTVATVADTCTAGAR